MSSQVNPSKLYKFLVIGILLPLLLGAFVYTFYNAYDEKKKLKENGSFAIGTITETYRGTRGRLYAKYVFWLGITKYHNQTRVLSGGKKNLNIGEKYEVIYCRDNPKISRIDLTKKIIAVPDSEGDTIQVQIPF